MNNLFLLKDCSTQLAGENNNRTWFLTCQVNVIEKAVLRANETVRSIDSEIEVVEQLTKETDNLI